MLSEGLVKQYEARISESINANLSEGDKHGEKICLGPVNYSLYVSKTGQTMGEFAVYLLLKEESQKIADSFAIIKQTNHIKKQLIRNQEFDKAVEIREIENGLVTKIAILNTNAEESVGKALS